MARPRIESTHRVVRGSRPVTPRAIPTMSQLEARYECPVELTLAFLGGKWKTVILCWLKQGPLRYGELRRHIPGISDKVLSQRLDELERLGLVCKVAGTSRQGSAHRVWRMTPRGEGLRTALGQLYDWGVAMAKELSIDVAPRPREG